jgi:hypothetical protein
LNINCPSGVLGGKPLFIRVIIVKSYGGLAIIPPSFNDWEHPKQVRTKGGQHCKRLRTNVPTGGFTAVGNGTCWDPCGVVFTARYWVVKFNSNYFKNSAADVLRGKFVVVILPGTSFRYLFSFIGKLHVFAMV